MAKVSLTSGVPFCSRCEDVEVVATIRGSWLVTAPDGTLSVDRTHQYYYQVQTQIFVCGVEHGDLCVCVYTSKFPNESTPTMHCERIFANKELWSSYIYQSNNFFEHYVLPELLHKASIIARKRRS